MESIAIVDHNSNIHNLTYDIKQDDTDSVLPKPTGAILYPGNEVRMGGYAGTRFSVCPCVTSLTGIYLPTNCMQANLVWWCVTMTLGVTERVGFLSSMSRSQWGLKSIKTSPALPYLLERFATKCGMVVHHHEPECCVTINLFVITQNYLFTQNFSTVWEKKTHCTCLADPHRARSTDHVTLISMCTLFPDRVYKKCPSKDSVTGHTPTGGYLAAAGDKPS